MLVDEQNGNVLALRGVVVKRLFDHARLGLGVDDEEVLLAVGDVLEMLRPRPC